jgi:hypothetical protein
LNQDFLAQMGNNQKYLKIENMMGKTEEEVSQFIAENADKVHIVSG